MAQTICASGLAVKVAAGNQPASRLLSLASSSPSSTTGVYYQGLGEYDRTWSVYQKAAQMMWGFGRRATSWLDEQSSRPCAVFCYGTHLPLLSRLRRWCRSHNVPLICDVVEWYDHSQVLGGRFGPLYWLNEYSLRRVVPQCNGVIVISSLLSDFYQRHGIPVVRIPPTADLQEQFFQTIARNDARQRIELVYSGVPGKRKDSLGNAIHGLAMVDPEARHFRLRIVGPSEKWIRRMVMGLPLKGVECLGHQSHRQTLEVVGDSDFSVLLRPRKRFADAGFPTKVVESLACGTPVICNLTSDLGDYIRHGIEGVVLRKRFGDCICRSTAHNHEMGQETIEGDGTGRSKASRTVL